MILGVVLMKKISIPKEFIIPVIVFVVVFFWGTFRLHNVISGINMACLFGSISSLLAYIITAIKKHKSGVCLLTFIILMVLFLVTTPFTSGYMAVNK